MQLGCPALARRSTRRGPVTVERRSGRCRHAAGGRELVDARRRRGDASYLWRGARSADCSSRSLTPVLLEAGPAADDRSPDDARVRMSVADADPKACGRRHRRGGAPIQARRRRARALASVRRASRARTARWTLSDPPRRPSRSGSSQTSSHSASSSTRSAPARRARAARCDLCDGVADRDQAPEPAGWTTSVPTGPPPPSPRGARRSPGRQERAHRPWASWTARVWFVSESGGSASSPYRSRRRSPESSGRGHPTTVVDRTHSTVAHRRSAAHWRRPAPGGHP